MSAERDVGSGEKRVANELRLRVRVELPGFTLDVDDSLALEGVTAVFGASGSGKSTLLRAIAGFERPVSGRIEFGGGVWFDHDAGIDLPAHQRPVGSLFQDARLFDHLDVRRNLEFGERFRGRVARPERDEVVETLGLGPLFERRVDSLSGGERQRVALGRTLLSSPSLLLLDEPLSGLDRDRKAEILPYLRSVIRRFRMPTLFVSHDLDEVAQLSERVWILSSGRLESRGPTAEVVEDLDLEPIMGRFEAGVLVEGQVTRHDPRLHLTLVDLGGDELTLPLTDGVAPGEVVRVRIRSRDVAVATSRPRGLSIRNVLPGTIIELIEERETGSVQARIQLREHRLRARLTLAAVEELGLEVGSSIYALVKSVSLEQGS